MKKNHSAPPPSPHQRVTSVVPSSSSATPSATASVPMNGRRVDGGSAMGLVGGLVDAMRLDNLRATPSLSSAGGPQQQQQQQHQQQQQQQQQQPLSKDQLQNVDFIGPADAVKDLFSLPYSNDAGVSVALHNIGGGTLILDAADEGAYVDDKEQMGHQRRGRRRPRPRPNSSSSVTENVEDSSSYFPAPPRPGRFPLPRQDSNDLNSTMAVVSAMLQHNSLNSALPNSDGTTKSSREGTEAVPTIEKVASTDAESEETSPKSTRDTIIVAPPTVLSAVPQSGLGVDALNSFSITDQSVPVSKAENNARTGDDEDKLLNMLEPPEFYADDAGVSPPREPRQYLNWKFHEMNLVVASDALIYRSNDAPAQDPPSSKPEDGTSQSQPHNNASSQALIVRVADAEDMRSKLRVHQDMVKRDMLAPADDCHRPRSEQGHIQQTGPQMQEQKQFYPSYADALLSANASAKDEKEENAKDENVIAKSSGQAEHSSSVSPNLDAVHLQTCIIPTTGVSPELREVGFAQAPPNSRTDAASNTETPGGSAASSMPSSSPTGSSSSPVCTVLDAYLDNIMANVPQLALCLREKGFIQSIKLLQTEDIPTLMMNSATLGMDEATATGSGGEPLFSPHMVDMNATMLLRFLKANCSRDNSTYLLRRNPGEANIQLYDITSISTQRQKKWIWWLAMISYRFALRLVQLSRSVVPEEDKAMKRSFRARQRSLFQNALELLEDLADMDGGRHETICAAVNEHLADTFLWNESHGEDTAENDDMQFVESKDGDGKCWNKKAGQHTSLPGTNPSRPTQPMPTTSSLQPYGNVTTDALNKAQGHLLNGIRKLSPLLEREREAERARQLEAKRKKHRRRKKDKSSKGGRVVKVHNDDSSSSSSDSEDQEEDDSFLATPEIETISMQLYGLLHKLINVSLRLAEHHLRNYWSSSAMQELRTAARKIADAIALLRPLGLLHVSEGTKKFAEITSPSAFLQSLRYQYAWLWEYCGHFARSFAADELWRERGHACGDDIVSLLQDVESACCFLSPLSRESLEEDSPLWIGSVADHQARAALITSKSKGLISLCFLSPLVAAPIDFEPVGTNEPGKQRVSGPIDADAKRGAVEVARELLEKQKQMKRDERLVLVAASVCYSRAVATFIKLLSDQNSCKENKFGRGASETFSDCAGGKRSDVIATTSVDDNAINPVASSNVPLGPLPRDSSILSLLRQRLGDTCNEIGKFLLAEVKNILETPFAGSEASKETLQATGPLLLSAKFWFNEGLRQFNECKDLRNIALLRCNLCQCYKIRANANVALPKLSEESDSSTHAEACLKHAADNLQMAHEVLGERGVDTVTWDMVSTELAATLLVLGVRRRQSLLGRGTTPVVIQALRLNPGKERDIIEPIEKAVEIYTTLKNAHQAAAGHYQLALFYSKVWTCQRDEAKTREKLSAAFKHFGAAHQYFYSAMRGNEPTFVILSLDFSNLYSAVSGQKECAEKALMCCIDTCDAFAPEAIRAASKRQAMKGVKPISADDKEWFEKMSALAAAVEERIFKLLQNLVKIEKESSDGTETYKTMYRAALTAKMALKKTEKCQTIDAFTVDPDSCSFGVHGLLRAMNTRQQQKSA